MKTIKLLVLATAFIGFTSCDDDKNDIQLIDVTSETFTNLYAPLIGGYDQMGNFTPFSGEFTKFDFATGITTTSETEWDIAFRGLDIIINGGVSSGAPDEPARTGNGAVYIANTTIDLVTDVNLTLFTQDDISGYAIPGDGNGWYTHLPNPVNLIIANPGKILVIKTRDGKYAKVGIISYYKDAPENADLDSMVNEPRYYTFNYEYQPNDGVLTF